MRLRQISILPPKALLGPLVLRPALFWLFVRAAMAFLGALVTPPIVSFGVLGVVSVMVIADTKILRERPFLDNLGIGKMGSAAIVVVALETAVGVAGRMLIA